MTAHDVVSRVRRLLSLKHVGHGGTLDPMATGVLPIAVGKACRLLRFLDGDKVYLAEIQLGLSTDTDDITGSIISEAAAPTEPRIVEQALSAFVGSITQIPPNFSAVHVG